MKWLSPMEYQSFSTYDKQDMRDWQRRMESDGWGLYQIEASRTSSYVSVAYKRRMARDANGFTDSDLHRGDEVNALEMIRQHDDGEKTGAQSMFAYPGIFNVLYDREWIDWVEETQKFKLSEAGRTALASQK